MGLISVHDGQQKVTLGGRCVVGRAASAHLRLDDPRVSSEHASLSHDGMVWRLRDLGSRNGTWLNGERVTVQENHRLRAGDVIAFGSEEARWELAYAGPPEPRVLLHGQRHPLVNGVLELHDQVLELEADGAAWILETADGRRPVVDQETVELGERTAVLELPPADAPGGAATETMVAAPPPLSDLTLAFEVSSDEEHVALTLTGPRFESTLPSRAHHYVLMLLARARLDDAASGVADAAEHGWVYADEFAEQVSTSPRNLNVLIWRARKELKALGIPDAEQIVERRPDSKQIRLGGAAVTVA